MTCEFLNDFLEELPRLSPNREIEFCIDVESDIALVSMPPYKMATIELRELKKKEQLLELLDKGFIRPSISPRLT